MVIIFYVIAEHFLDSFFGRVRSHVTPYTESRSDALFNGRNRIRRQVRIKMDPQHWGLVTWRERELERM